MVNYSPQIQTDLELNPLGERKRLVFVLADPDHAPSANEIAAKKVKKRSGMGSGVSGAVRWLFEEKFAESHLVLWLQRDHQGAMVKVTRSRIDALGAAISSALLVIDYEHCRLTLASEIIQVIRLLRQRKIKINVTVFSHYVILADAPIRQLLSENLSPETELNFFPKSGGSYVAKGDKPCTAYVFRNVCRILQK